MSRHYAVKHCIQCEPPSFARKPLTATVLLYVTSTLAGLILSALVLGYLCGCPTVPSDKTNCFCVLQSIVLYVSSLNVLQSVVLYVSSLNWTDFLFCIAMRDRPRVGQAAFL